MPVRVQQRIRRELRHEKLTQFGYNMYASERSRHIALTKAVHEYGGLSVYRSLNLLELWNREDDPELASIARQDKQWVKRKYYGTRYW
jgi:hypothetical protein